MLHEQTLTQTRRRAQRSFAWCALPVAACLLLMLAGCGGSSSGGGGDSGSSSAPADSGGSSSSGGGGGGGGGGSTPTSVDPGNPAALSNRLSIKVTAPTAGTMTKFLYAMDYYVIGTIVSSELGMPATATATGGTTTTLTLSPNTSNLVPYCDVGSTSQYSYWVAAASPGDSVNGSPMTIVITWPPFSASGTIHFRCSGVASDVPNAATNSAIETTVITATP